MVNHAIAAATTALSYRGRKARLIFGMGIPELTIILIVTLLIFGPRSLPKIGSAVGRTAKNIRNGFEEELNDTDKGTGDGSIDVVPTSDEEPCPSCGFLNPSQNTYCAKCSVKL